MPYILTTKYKIGSIFCSRGKLISYLFPQLFLKQKTYLDILPSKMQTKYDDFM